MKSLIIFEWYLLRIIAFLVMGRSVENSEEKKETDKRKALKSEEKEKRRIRGQSKSNNIHLWFYKNTFLKKGVCTFIPSKHTNYDIIEITHKLQRIFA